MRLKDKTVSASRIISNNYFLFRYIWKFVPTFLVQEIFNAALGGIIGSMFTLYTKLFYDSISLQKSIRYIFAMSGAFLVIDIAINFH